MPDLAQFPAPELPSTSSLLQTLAEVRVRHLLKLASPRSQRGGKIKGAFLILGLIVLALTVTLGTAAAFGSAGSPEAAHQLLATMCLVAFAAVVAGCLATSLQSLYLNDDVHFMASLPIPMRLIFVAKIGDVALGSAPGTLVLLAVCVGYVLGRAANAAFVLMAVPVVLALTAIGVLVATIVTSAIIRFGPARHTRPTLVLTSLSILGATSLAWKGAGGAELTDSATTASDSWPALILLPPGWAAAILAAIAGEDGTLALPAVGLLFGTLVLVALAGARLFPLAYARTLEREDLIRGGAAPRKAPRPARWLLRLVPFALLHWVKREWMLVGRDLSRWSAALVPVAGAGIYAIISLVGGLGSEAGDSTQFWLSHAPVLLIPWGISMGATIFAIGAEGSAVEMIRSMPVRPGVLILGKFLAYLLPIAGVSLTIAAGAVAISPGEPRDNYLFLLLTLVLAAVFCGIDVGVSAMAPRFEADQAHRSTRLRARGVALFAGLAAGSAITLGLALSPLGRRSLGDALASSDASAVVWIGLLAIGAAAPWISMTFGTVRMRRLLACD